MVFEVPARSSTNCSHGLPSSENVSCAQKNRPPGEAYPHYFFGTHVRLRTPAHLPTWLPLSRS
jgi:hypothetical protein